MDSRNATAERLAHIHYANEPEITDIYRCESDREGESDPVKLLEVNAATIPMGVMPLRLDPAPASGINYPAVVVEVTQQEFEQIREAKLPLPAGWRLGEPIQRPAAAGPTVSTSAVAGSINP
jgi:hypothetical protein